LLAFFFVVSLLTALSAPAEPLAEAIEWIKQSQWKKAEEALDKCSPADLTAVYWKGFVLFRTGRYPESIATISRYLEQKPDSAGGHKILGLSSFMQGDAEAAERELKRAVDLDPADSEALYYFGRIRFTRHDLPEAARVFERVVALDASSVRGHNQLGQTYEGLSRFEEARKAYLRAIELERTQPARSEWPYFNLGLLSLKEGKPQEAAGYLRQALERNPSWPEGKVQLAVALASANQYDEARTLLAGVIEADPRNAGAHYQMGRLLLKLRKPEEARRHLELFESLKKQ
jgi:protein O-mannosyl-transferase